MKISKKAMMPSIIIFLLIAISTMGSAGNDLKDEESQQKVEQEAPRGAVSKEAEIKEIKYEVMRREDNKLVDNIWVLIDPNADGEKVARTVKKNDCSKPCLIQVFDNKQAYLKDLEYTLLLGSSASDVQEKLTAWKEKNYVFVADHLVGIIWNGEDKYNEYPQRDWFYEEQKAKE